MGKVFNTFGGGNNKRLVSITVDTMPTKTTYSVGDALDYTGIKVVANFSDMTSADVTDSCVYSPAEGTLVTSGLSSVSVSYQGVGTSFPISIINIYGIQRDITNSNPVYTRTDNAVGKTFSASVGSTAGHSDFDNCMPWAGMVRETIGSDVMVKIPKFWFKRWLDGNIEHIQIADGPATGFAVHPMFMYGQTECDEIYVGAYHTASGYVSQTGKAPLVNITRAAARTGSVNKGSGWSQLDFSANCGIILLALVETASNNIQVTVGRGNVNQASSATPLNSGSCDSVPNLTGRPSGTDGKTGVVYRGIENLWGNVWQWVDGINMNGATPYICLDPSKYADDTSANYTQLSYNIGSTSYSQSYISRIGLDENNPFAIMPTQASGSETTYYCDAIWSSTGWRVCVRGGLWAFGGLCGLFAVGVTYDSSAAYSGIGARLLYRPI